MMELHWMIWLAVAVGGGVIVLLIVGGVLGRMAAFAGRMLGGLVALLAFGPLGGVLGVTLGVNLVNALVLATLGVPGFGLLLLLHWGLGI